jgi:hypothetical protein
VMREMRGFCIDMIEVGVHIEPGVDDMQRLYIQIS